MPSATSCLKCSAEITPSQTVIYGVCAICWNAAAEAVGAGDRKVAADASPRQGAPESGS